MTSRRPELRLLLILVLATAILLSPRDASVSPQGEPWDIWSRCGGPIGGLGYDVRMHPTCPDTMFVTDSFAGVFRSFDGGQNWAPVNNGIDIRGGDSGDAIKVFCLTIDPVNPNTVWLGLQDYRGIYKSTDLGENWTLKVNGIEETVGISFRGISVDPDHPDTVYAAAELSSTVWADSLVYGREFDKTMGVVYKTLDGGGTWFEIWRGDNLARYVLIDPRDTQTLYLSTGILDREAANSDTTTNNPGGVGVLKSTDGGASWETKNYGLTNLYIGTLFMHPDDPDILLAGADNGSWGDSLGTFLTINGGDEWTRVLPYGSNSVEFAVGDSLVAYSGNACCIFKSDDGGWNWAQVSSDTSVWGAVGVEAGFPIDFQVDPRDSDRIFANNYGGGNFLSTDGGHTWSVASKGYTGAHVRDLAVAGDDPARVYAAARTGIFVSYNLGEDWHGRTVPIATGVEWNAVAINPLDSHHLLSGNMFSRMIYASRDGAETWVDGGLVLSEGKAWRCFAFSPSDTGTIYAGSGGVLSAGRFSDVTPGVGVWKSIDSGQTWNEANDPSYEWANVAELAVRADNPKVVYAATTNHGVLKTIDGGKSWSEFNSGLPPGPTVFSIAIDPADTNHIFTGLDNAGLYESFDGGSSWNPAAIGLPVESDITDIVYCPTNDKLIYISDLKSGVYRSTNGGWTWVAVNDSLRTRAVNALAFSGDGTTLYAGTEGEGVFRLDGAGPVAAVEDNPPGRGRPNLRQNYPNPFRSTTTISYRAAKGTYVRLEVFDAAGRLVRVLIDEKASMTGRHEAVWDGLISDGCKAAAGVYFYKLKVGDRVETKRMVLAK